MEEAVSDYTISFKSPIYIESNGECLVKYVFPKEFDFSNWVDKEIEGSGMFVNENGEISNDLISKNVIFDDA
jgi:hypothetical protein